MPMRETRLGEVPVTEAPIFYLFNDDKESLQTGVARLDTGFALVESPASATQRLVTDILILDVEPAQVDVRSSFLVFQVRDERNETMFAGRRTDRLKLETGYAYSGARFFSRITSCRERSHSFFSLRRAFRETRAGNLRL